MMSAAAPERAVKEAALMGADVLLLRVLRTEALSDESVMVMFSSPRPVISPAENAS